MQPRPGSDSTQKTYRRKERAPIPVRYRKKLKLSELIPKDLRKARR